jgi:hypothetical protein
MFLHFFGLGVCLFILLCIITILTLGALNKHLPRWFCDKMGWHLAPESIGFDGCSMNGTCPRCGEHVLQDSQGNWF